MNKTPDNINTLSVKEILELIDDSHAGNIAGKNARYRVCKLIYEILGYDISKDLLLALLAEPSAQLVLATAGGGKTTFSQVKIILEKLFRKGLDGKPLSGDRVMCLVYNRHNVKPMIDKHEQLVRKIYASGVQGLNIDSSIKARTMHSFCNMWANEFIGKTGLLGSNLLRDNEVTTMLGTVYKVIAKKFRADYMANKLDDMLALYTLLRETLVPYEEVERYEAFVKLDIDKEVLIETYKTFDMMKNRKGCHDFTDMLHKLLELLRSDESVRTHIQNYYHYIVADEVQDLTPVMMEILTLVKGENTPILCIGDEDQSIYGFRGASIENTLKFGERFEHAEIYSLATNRRCGENIVELSREVVSWNTLRFEKKIESVKPGGNIEYIPYQTHEGQMINLMRKLESMSSRDLNNTCICYRNKKSSLFLADKLEKSKIPFNILSGFKPFSHEIYNHIIDILNILHNPYDREDIVNLYKIVPYLTRGAWFKLLGYEPKDKSFTTDREYKHFTKYDLGALNKNFRVQKVLQVLELISNKMESMPMSNYIDDIFELFEVAFWENKKYLNGDEETDELYTTEALKFFKSNLYYKAFYQEYLLRKGIFERNNKTHTGMTLSTFHGLKGLEFENVILIDLEDEIFPNFAKIDAIDCYSEKGKQELKEGETRLFFVAVTRAISNLTMYYNEECPTIYIDWLLQGRDIVNPDTNKASKDNINIKNVLTDAGVSRESNLITERMNIFSNLIIKVSEEVEVSSRDFDESQLARGPLTEEEQNIIPEPLEPEVLELISKINSSPTETEHSTNNTVLDEEEELSLEDDEELVLEDDEELVLEDDEEELVSEDDIEEKIVIDVRESKESKSSGEGNAFLSTILDRF